MRGAEHTGGDRDRQHGTPASGTERRNAGAKRATTPLADHILRLQQTAGNRAVGRMLDQLVGASHAIVQRTLFVGAERYKEGQESVALEQFLSKANVPAYEKKREALLQRFAAWIKANKMFTGWPQILEMMAADLPKEISIGEQTYHLLGTMHGVSGRDNSGFLAPGALDKSAMILEYPSLANTGRAAFSEKDIEGVNDKTQATLAKAVASSGDPIEFIGADGRKAFGSGVKGGVHSISIRNKEQDDFEVKAKELLPVKALFKLAEGYVDGCFGKGDDGPGAILEAIPTIVEYKDGTNLQHVLISTYKRVRELAGKLSESKKAGAIGEIRAGVLSTLDQDLKHAVNYYQAERERYARTAEAQRLAYQKFLERLSTGGQAEPKGTGGTAQEHGASADQMPAEEPGGEDEVPDEPPSEAQTAKTLAGILQSANENIVSQLYDAICNVMLFTEVLASDKKNVVVAFGAEHTKPLEQFLGKVKAGAEGGK